MHRGVYHTEDTQLMGTTRVKQDEEANKNNSKRGVKNMEESNVGMKSKIQNKAYLVLQS